MSSSSAERVAEALKSAGTGFFAMLPCEKVRQLYDLITNDFKHVSLSREEEGVGICAGASLAAAKPAMLVQSSGIGNMINALCSLTKIYQLPLPIIASWRGVYKERIPAQVPLGKSLPRLLRALNMKCTLVKRKKDIALVSKAATLAYRRSEIHVILLSPAIWEEETSDSQTPTRGPYEERYQIAGKVGSGNPPPALTRFEILKAISSYIENKVVVCNLGIPSKELYSIKHQESNFYMLGSMGLASSIGLGISLFTSRQVIVIDGDGSLLTNLGTLSTITATRPRNLSIFAIDNGVHGSTGNQPTATNLCVDLEATARGLGFRKTYKVASREDILTILQTLSDGPNFVHFIARPGNADVSEVPLSPLQIRRNVSQSLKK
jgi:sulfopyruvate decarboxylase beta subunit